MMKELFLDTEIEIILFPEADILTFSGGLVDDYEEEDDELPLDPIG